MDVVKAVETYITKMVSTPSSMKVLLLDNHTVSTSVACVAPFHGSSWRSDSHRLPVRNTIYAPLTPSIPHGQDRQQEARAHGAYEVYLLPTTERRELRSSRCGAEGTEVWRVLPLSVSGLSRPSPCFIRPAGTCRLQQHSEQDCDRATC